ncbi:MAG TPA: DUF1353 domain-containing protein [Aeromicrobium sp.]|nr:DUF1353 domain-containing protein [Aeromicrobium sp.]HKY58052.1 DUF1353 domain-containing protein [Aeromicrobium sp.]
MDTPIDGQALRFYDGGTDETPPAPARPPVIVLTREFAGDVRDFRMSRRIAYRDRFLGELLVPGDLEDFDTDLTSVPAVFAWLVPKTGAHLPAALLHDGLVYSPGQPPSYISTDGHDVDRAEANRVFRDAMADTGTGVVRRWLMWSAVTAVTMVEGTGTGWSRWRRWHYRLAAVGSLLVIGLLGIAATVDLFDVRLAWIPPVPWMGAQGTLTELTAGVAAGVTLPFLLALTWGQFWRAGAILGISLALLLHVSIAILGLTLLYQVLERIATRWPMIAVGSALLFVLGSAVTLVANLT